MKKTTVLAVLFLSGMILAQEPVQPYRVYFAPPAPANMQPGNMDQPDFWSKAPASSQFRQLRSGKKTEHPTVFHATYNQNGLFLKTVCSEPEAANLNFTDLGRKKDDASSFDGPVVEVFIDPAFTRKHSAHFAANINGTTFDRLDSDMIWEYPFSAKTVPAKDKKSFTIYFFIPWRETTNENPDSGYLFFMNLTDHPVIGFNIARERNCSVNEYSQWMVSAKTFMEPANYGAVVFSGCPNAENRLLTLLDRRLIARGIDFQGSVGPDSSKLLCKILNSNLLAAKSLMEKMTDSAQKGAYLKQYQTLSREVSGAKTFEQLKALVSRCVQLAIDVEKYSLSKMEKDLFNMI